MKTKAEIVEQLKHGFSIVTFNKINGERREMLATLDETLIPKNPVHVTNTENPVDFPSMKRKTNDDVVSCWAPESNGWRSFRIDHLIEIKEASK